MQGEEHTPYNHTLESSMETYNSSVCSFGYYWTINIQNCHRGPLLRIISRRIISGKSTIQTSDCFIQFYQQIITTWLTSLSRITWTVSTIIVHIKVDKSFFHFIVCWLLFNGSSVNFSKSSLQLRIIGCVLSIIL